ncbi:MAG: hypothetical protein NXI24_05210 [bacterium]|nr:hypothetical protein [bacterium]
MQQRNRFVFRSRPVALVLCLCLALSVSGAGCKSNWWEDPEDALRTLAGLIDPARADSTLPLRYWLVRSRLTQRFLRTGSASPGYGLPAERIRNPSGLAWSDATIHLGWYMAVLATEHQLIREGKLPVLPGAPVATVIEPITALGNTQSELYFALAALERLDQQGEAAFASPVPCGASGLDWPGFFIRDDVPANFSVAGVPVFTSDFSAPTQRTQSSGAVENYLVEPNIIYDKEMSQDQVYHLLFGLAFVRKYMSGVVAGNLDLGLWAEILAERLVAKMSADSWRISNPACGKRVERGEDARAFAYGASRAVTALSFGRLNFQSGIDGSLWAALIPYADAGLVGGPLIEDTAYTDNLHMLMTLAAVGRSWEDFTTARLVAYAGIYDWYAYPLAHVALHGQPPDWFFYEPLLRDQTFTMLNAAPWEGPTSYGSVPGWRSTHRFLRGRSLQQRTPEDLPTDYNGLDFLLLYNLSLIAGL